MAVAAVLGVWALILFGPDDDWWDDDDDAATIHWLEQALKQEDFEVDGDQLAFDQRFDEITRAADWWGKR
jgi:hypothetical protein